MNWGELSTLFDRIYLHSDDGVWIAAADVNDIRYANPAIESLFRTPREELYADPLAYIETVHREDRSPHREFRRSLREWAAEGEPPTDDRSPSATAPRADASAESRTDASAESRTHAFRVYDEEDAVRWLSERVFPIRNRNGTIRYWGGIVRDVTDRKNQTETLRVQVEELEVLNQVVRHDIRNEANLGIGVLRSLRRDSSAASETVAQLEAIFGRIVDLTETARDMTDVITTLSEEPEPVSVRRSLRREIANASTLSNAATVTIDGEIPDVEVQASDILSAVFRNLLKNAIQHNDAESPEVIVSSSIANDHVLIHVADNGPGIPDEKKEQIFESGETLAGSNGSGFGLSLVGTLVEQYDGRIYVWDNEPKGSVFTVRLPRAEG